MVMTFDEIKNEALLIGYDFHSLCSKNKNYTKEYIYGYTLADDKVSYLESIANGKVIYADRIKCFEKELEEFRKITMAMPHTKVMSGFYLNKDVIADDGSIYDTSLYRVVLLNEDKKTVVVKDVEYIDYGYSEALVVYSAILDYEKVLNHVNTKGLPDFFENVYNYTYNFEEESGIRVASVFVNDDCSGD